MKILFVFIICVAGFFPSFAQQRTYKNLVMEGGGIRGFAYVGAIQVLDSLNILSKIERVAGTSVGAIQATMLAIGYTPKEMAGLIADLPINEFSDGTIAGGLSRLRYRFGFFKGQRLTNWLEKLIITKTGNAAITFRELHEKKNEKGYKDLYITGSDLSYRRLVIFSHETFPDMKIRDALRISFSIPLYFEPVLINDSGRVVTDKKDPRNHLMVDGGLLSNYPVDIFDRAPFMDCDSNNRKCKNPETLGLLLETPEQLEYSLRKSEVPLAIGSLTDYVKAIYQTAVDHPNPDEKDLKRTITISDLGIKSRIRKMSSKQIGLLVESGRESVLEFFKTAN